jgi:hypothetical protein
MLSNVEVTIGTPAGSFVAVYCSVSSSDIGGLLTNCGVVIFFASSSMRTASASCSV